MLWVGRVSGGVGRAGACGGGSAQAGWPVGAVHLCEGHLVVEAVDGGGGGVDERRHGRQPLHALQQAHKAGYVAVHVRARVLDSVAHTSLGSKVQNVRCAAHAQHLCNCVAIIQVCLDCVYPLLLQQCRASALQADAVIRVEVVQANHSVALQPQRRCRMEAYKTSRAGDKHSLRLDGVTNLKVRVCGLSKEHLPPHFRSSRSRRTGVHDRVIAARFNLAGANGWAQEQGAREGGFVKCCSSSTQVGGGRTSAPLPPPLLLRLPPP